MRKLRKKSIKNIVFLFNENGASTSCCPDNGGTKCCPGQ